MSSGVGKRTQYVQVHAVAQPERQLWAFSGGLTQNFYLFFETIKRTGNLQINSKNWCRKGRRGGICNIKCEGESTNSPTKNSDKKICLCMQSS